jgi:hypothetical protein
MIGGILGGMKGSEMMTRPHIDQLLNGPSIIQAGIKYAKYLKAASK